MKWQSTSAGFLLDIKAYKTTQILAAATPKATGTATQAMQGACCQSLALGFKLTLSSFKGRGRETAKMIRP